MAYSSIWLIFRTRLRPAPPGDAKYKWCLKDSSRITYFKKLGIISGWSVNCGNRCDTSAPSSFSSVIATACSHAKVMFKINLSFATLFISLVSSSRPLGTYSWKVPLAWLLIPKRVYPSCGVGIETLYSSRSAPSFRCSQAFANLNAFLLFAERLTEKFGRFEGVQISLRLVGCRFHCVFLRSR